MGLRQMGTRHWGETGRKEIEAVCGYFTTHADRMHCERYLAAGYPIATGVIEGACRHLVKDRMDRSGMRWTQSDTQAMLDVRNVHQSAYWNDFHRQQTVKQNELIKPYRQLLDKPEILAA